MPPWPHHCASAPCALIKTTQPPQCRAPTQAASDDGEATMATAIMVSRRRRRQTVKGMTAMRRRQCGIVTPTPTVGWCCDGDMVTAATMTGTTVQRQRRLYGNDDDDGDNGAATDDSTMQRCESDDDNDNDGAAAIPTMTKGLV
ncbi:hypothetical protein EDB85DRAFT_1895032 [Lactarius pseudohatsudake]|nr:hypothetical protein EDB85DRAFT_1895032 [Lactarius pseudohatsudake]